MIRITLPLDGPDPDFARSCYAADEYEADADVDLATETVTWTGGRVWRAGAVEAEQLSVAALEFEVGSLSGWNTEALEAAEGQSGTFEIEKPGVRVIDARRRRLGRSVA